MQKEIQRSNTSDSYVPELILETVSDLTGEKVEELPPIRESIDPDALNQLIQHKHKQELRLEFQYHYYLITVDSTGTITFQDHRTK